MDCSRSLLARPLLATSQRTVGAAQIQHFSVWATAVPAAELDRSSEPPGCAMTLGRELSSITILFLTRFSYASERPSWQNATVTRQNV